MLSNIQKNIILRAVRIRMSEGEELEMILESYPRLIDGEKNEIRGAYGQKEA